ncbi:MAG TPA: hydroxyisourate hydrolase [Candidatus Dormibacteraeota bacterium]|nr:hydroxyisourate hydrolase [Candidatus Dormibacteraeota bacterium]
MSVSTHVLDTADGRPAAGVPVTLSHREATGAWEVVGNGITDADGRVRELSAVPLEAGDYRLEFDTATYFKVAGMDAFYPEVLVVFKVTDPGAHHHVPLLLSPFGYSTYRGT